MEELRRTYSEVRKVQDEQKDINATLAPTDCCIFFNRDKSL